MKLHDHYDAPTEARIAATAFAERIDQADAYQGVDDGDGEALFVLLCRGLAMYVDAWAEADTAGRLLEVVVDADDVDRPDRVLDPPLALRDTLMRLAVEQVEYYARHDLGLPTGDEDEPDDEVEPEDPA